MYVCSVKIELCWFVNDVRQIKSKNLTCFKESLNAIGRRLPIKRSKRVESVSSLEILVIFAMRTFNFSV